MPNLEALDPGSLPTYRDGVFLLVADRVPRPFTIEPLPPPRPLRLPLKLDELGPPGFENSLWGGAGFKSDSCAGRCGVYVWIGPKAPAADRTAVLQALAAVKT